MTPRRQPWSMGSYLPSPSSPENKKGSLFFRISQFLCSMHILHFLVTQFTIGTTRSWNWSLWHILVVATQFPTTVTNFISPPGFELECLLAVRCCVIVYEYVLDVNISKSQFQYLPPPPIFLLFFYFFSTSFFFFISVYLLIILPFSFSDIFLERFNLLFRRALFLSNVFSIVCSPSSLPLPSIPFFCDFVFFHFDFLPFYSRIHVGNLPIGISNCR